MSYTHSFSSYTPSSASPQSIGSSTSMRLPASLLSIFQTETTVSFVTTTTMQFPESAGLTIEIHADQHEGTHTHMHTHTDICMHPQTHTYAHARTHTYAHILTCNHRRDTHSASSLSELLVDRGAMSGSHQKSPRRAWRLLAKYKMRRHLAVRLFCIRKSTST